MELAQRGGFFLRRDRERDRPYRQHSPGISLANPTGLNRRHTERTRKRDGWGRYTFEAVADVLMVHVG